MDSSPQNGNETGPDDGDGLDVLTPESLVRQRGQKAPRGVLNSNRGFVELGSFTTNRLRQSPTVEFYPWTRPPATPKRESHAPSQKRDPLRLARYYQSLLDSGKFESRAALARHLEVSRARVTQVLNRLKAPANLKADVG